MKSISLWMFLTAGVLAYSASAGTLKVDRERSDFGIDVKASPPHSFTVEAKDYVAEVEIDESGEVTKAQFSFEFENLDSNNKKRDAKMARWMDVETCPQMLFELNEVREDGENRVGIGTIWMHGTSQEVEVPFSVEIEDEEVTISGNATLNYENWDLEVISILFFKVKPELNIHFTLVGSID